MKRKIFLLIITAFMFLIISGCGSVKDKQMTLDLSFGSRDGTYSGDIKNNLPDGKGKFEYKNSNNETIIFDGEFENGHFKNGDLIFPAQNRKYSGEYKNDSPTGYGKSFINNKLVYEGNWLNGLPSGKGKAYDANGNVTYDGNFESGLPMLDTVSVNQDVSFADWKYKVTSASTQLTVGNTQASGVFLIVTIDATNNANTQRQIGAQNFFMLFDDKGRRFNMNDKAMMDDRGSQIFNGGANAPWYLSQIGPSLSVQGIKIIFDIPKDAKNLKLVPQQGLGKANPVLVKESL